MTTDIADELRRRHVECDEVPASVPVVQDEVGLTAIGEGEKEHKSTPQEIFNFVPGKAAYGLDVVLVGLGVGTVIDNVAAPFASRSGVDSSSGADPKRAVGAFALR